MNGEKQKFIGGVDFDELRAQRVQVYNTITVDLATARSNEEHVFTGNYIYALEATDVDATLDIRFNELFRAAISFKKGRGVRVPFYRFYITNTAQAGKTITLAIGIEASDFEVFDVGKALGITGTVSVIQIPRTGYTQICKEAEAAATTALIHEVTAGKVLFLTGAELSIHGTAGPITGEGCILVSNAADVVQYKLLRIDNYYAAAGSGHPVANNWIPPVEIPAGYKVKVDSEVSISAVATIQGYEV